MPHRAPGSSGHSRQGFLSGKPIRYYRPHGSAEIRCLIDDGFQAFNAGRLSEACQIFAEKMLAPASDTTIGLTIAGAMTPAGLGGCVIEMMDRGLVDFPHIKDGREVLLCWQLDEERVAYWHELEAGFAGRQPIE